MKFSTFAAVVVISMLMCVDAVALSGSWRGELKVGQFKIPLVFNFTENAAGATECTIDSPSQGAKGIPAEVTSCTADIVTVECKSIGATFSGSIGNNAIEGSFTQRGYSFPLTLAPETSIDERRPQTPKAPFPYTTIDTLFTSTDGVKLSGTLTLPAGASNSKKVPAIVMVTGSGAQNRDEEILEHKPFAVIADHLARHGVASLRYDDRGTAASQGNFNTSTTYTFKDDAKSAISFLRAIPEIGKTGVLGHSEGGTIAFMLGAEDIPDFIISLAGMAVPAKETLMLQNSRALDKAGISGETKESCMKIISEIFDEIADQQRRGVSSHINIDSMIQASGSNIPLPIAESLKQTEKMRTPWFDTFLSLYPAQWLGNVKCPVLAINGDKDTQVDATSNISLIRSNIPSAETRIMPGLNHLMQHATTGEASEYGDIRETISPEILTIILDFIAKN